MQRAHEAGLNLTAIAVFLLVAKFYWPRIGVY